MTEMTRTEAIESLGAEVGTREETFYRGPSGPYTRAILDIPSGWTDLPDGRSIRRVWVDRGRDCSHYEVE